MLRCKIEDDLKSFLNKRGKVFFLYASRIENGLAPLRAMRWGTLDITASGQIAHVANGATWAICPF